MYHEIHLNPLFPLLLHPRPSPHSSIFWPHRASLHPTLTSSILDPSICDLADLCNLFYIYEWPRWPPLLSPLSSSITVSSGWPCFWPLLHSVYSFVALLPMVLFQTPAGPLCSLYCTIDAVFYLPYYCNWTLPVLYCPMLYCPGLLIFWWSDSSFYCSSSCLMPNCSWLHCYLVFYWSFYCTGASDLPLVQVIYLLCWLCGNLVPILRFTILALYICCYPSASDVILTPHGVGINLSFF